MEAEALTTQDLTTQDELTPAELTPALTVVTELAEPDLVTDEADVSALRAFDEFGVDEPICTALLAAGITHAFPIQALTLPIALDGHDIIGQARTGTGKTLAFGVPMLQQILSTERGKPSAPRGLVVVPTRELA